MGWSSERWMCFVWSLSCWFWLCCSCCCCLLLGLPVVVPVAECADHVHCGVLAFAPLPYVGGFEAGGFGASLSVALGLCALVSVAGEAGVAYCGGYVGGAVVLPGHAVPP